VGHRSWAKANNPYWSNHVATWYAGHQSAEEYCRRRDISTTSLKRWARHLLSSEDLHKRKKRLQNLRTKQLERQGKKARWKPRRRTFTYRYNMRTDSDAIAVRAFWGMHVEAMNWSGLGECGVCRGARTFALCTAHLAQSLRRFWGRNGLEIVASSECPGSIKQRC
jgi:hypothetical protein